MMLRAPAAEATWIIENFRPGTLEGWGWATTNSPTILASVMLRISYGWP